MKISFNINFHTTWGQKLCITGSVPELGMWETAFAREMNYVSDGNWQLELELPSDMTSIEYRYLLSINDQQVFEEWGEKHRVELNKETKKYTLYDYWQIRPDNIVFHSSAFTKSLFPQSSGNIHKWVVSKKKLYFELFAPRVEKDQSVAITGNQECLGNWDSRKALVLSCDSSPKWHLYLDATEIQYPLEYKFLVIGKDTGELAYWETGDNRIIHPVSHEESETICVSGLHFRGNLPSWKGAGTVIPLFSLRSEQSFGVGDLGDLKMFIDWIKTTHQRIIQILPINDTTSSHTWTDSYPYSAISIYALHPMYINLQWLGQLKDQEKALYYGKMQKELNRKDAVDYEPVVKYKLEYCRLFFEQEGKQWLETEEYSTFFTTNAYWLTPYAAYSYLRDKYNSTDFTQWGQDRVYDKQRINRLCSKDSESYPDISFIFFLQYALHKQFKDVSDYARKNGVVLKGDLPIGVNRNSIDVWVEPHYFNMDSQAGAPPDDFSTIGQNWSFPTYNWGAMEKDHFSWWKKRFAKLGDYFDCFRIDHILGFFRIWEIPTEYIQGLCGHFNPALPLSKEEIEQYGLPFNEARFTTPHINEEFLPELFGNHTEEVKRAYLTQSSSRHYTLKNFCDTQEKIQALFCNKTDEVSSMIMEGLFKIANEILFLRDPFMNSRFHPRISTNLSYLYRELSNTDRYAFDHLYWDFFYHRHNNFWKAQAFKRLTPLITSTDMLVCGEDLGMIPQSVPDVMNKLQILSLEIERMPKTAEHEFADLKQLPYLSVCTTSTHDMSPLRSWWKEDKNKTQLYYNDVLKRPGEATEECTSDIAQQIIENHLNAPAMFTIIPLQDWLATDDTLKRVDIEGERINVPANPKHYWRYRMHITIEGLMKADELNKRIISSIEKSERK